MGYQERISRKKMFQKKKKKPLFHIVGVGDIFEVFWPWDCGIQNFGQPPC